MSKEELRKKISNKTNNFTTNNRSIESIYIRVVLNEKNKFNLKIKNVVITRVSFL